jgi:hypothetical protein
VVRWSGASPTVEEIRDKLRTRPKAQREPLEDKPATAMFIEDLFWPDLDMSLRGATLRLVKAPPCR